MKTITLHTEKIPSGRCLLLGKALASVVASNPRDGLRIAEDLFTGKHHSENAIKVPLVANADLTELRRLALEFGISMTEE